jgi:hypothetical protein
MAAIEWVRKVISVRRGVGGGRIVSQSRLARASSGVTDIDAVDEGHEIQQHDEANDAQRRLAQCARLELKLVSVSHLGLLAFSFISARMRRSQPYARKQA